MAFLILVRYQDWKCTTILVISANRPETIFYTVDNHWSNPPTVFKSASGAELGNTTFHVLTSGVETVVLNGGSSKSDENLYSVPATHVPYPLSIGIVTCKVGTSQR